MTNWLEKTKRPVLPIYLAALVWPIMALVLPIYTLGGLIATAVISAGRARRAGAGRLRHRQ